VARIVVFMIQKTKATHPDYKELPEFIKYAYTEEQYAWLTDEGRARLLERETQPEWDVIE